MNDELAVRILQFAHHCGGGETSAEAVARGRGWIDDEGQPTRDGRKLLEELARQAETRSVFRGVA